MEDATKVWMNHMDQVAMDISDAVRLLETKEIPGILANRPASIRTPNTNQDHTSLLQRIHKLETNAKAIQAVCENISTRRTNAAKAIALQSEAIQSILDEIQQELDVVVPR